MTKSRRIDLIGQKFGRLTVIEASERRTASRAMYWRCRCECGNEKEITANNLRSGQLRMLSKHLYPRVTAGRVINSYSN